MKKLLILILLCTFYGNAAYAQESLTLDDCITIALRQNPQLKSSFSQLEISKANRLQSYSRS
ncbi:hypothetical protein ACFL6I_01985 [candidate division KSB1 bacterium]